MSGGVGSTSGEAGTVVVVGVGIGVDVVGVAAAVEFGAVVGLALGLGVRLGLGGVPLLVVDCAECAVVGVLEAAVEASAGGFVWGVVPVLGGMGGAARFCVGVVVVLDVERGPLEDNVGVVLPVASGGKSGVRPSKGINASGVGPCIGLREVPMNSCRSVLQLSSETAVLNIFTDAV